MERETAQSVTALLSTAEEPDRVRLTQVFPLIYDELRRVAQRYMSSDRKDHTLQATALVNEAFMRMRQGDVSIRGEAHALALAAVAMRCILVDHARRRGSLKRGGRSAQRYSLSDVEAGEGRELEILELDDLLRRYAELDPRRARVVELRFFAGMTNDEISVALGVARSTVVEDWAVARAWIRAQLKSVAADGRKNDGA